MEKTINLKINGTAVAVPDGTTILDAAKSVGIVIPTLCYMRKLNEIGACRVCVVEVKGARSLVASCVFPVSENMEVFTHTPKVLKSRKTTVELLLSDHDKKCLSCLRNTNCELQKLSRDLGCDEAKFGGETNAFKSDASSPYLVRDNNKCILCRRCVAMCAKVQDVAVIGANARGFKTHIGCAFGRGINDVPCVACGQCITVCPTGALTERDDSGVVSAALSDPQKTVVCGTAPSTRIGLAEEFGLPAGSNVEGKMVSALRMLGFDKVFDINATADLTIMEEGTELLNRIKNGGALPMFTSCSPGWVKYVETYYPEFIKNISSCKSPQAMFGAVVKTYYAEKNGLNPADIFTVGVMPCIAKKFERLRDGQSAAGAGIPDIDAVLTVREIARMVKRRGIDFNSLPEGRFDTPLGVASGAGFIFGATGGVMEAALRTVAEILDGKPLEKVDFKAVRGTKGIKEAVVKAGGREIRVCAASGIANAKAVLEDVKAGKARYDFIEVMTCPGGCVNGGGQPVKNAVQLNYMDIPETRAKPIYAGDAKNKIRKSHENPVVKVLYDDYFGAPNSHKAHEVLHTVYAARKKYKE
ncbi:MAG: [FeFe] hydrogenase, group A [Clostridiales bacterium]|jgi:NADP-reducing hydrogenase subunit HndD|nr:[FeFe] hydrogenase, group A [Clostridiales bacterium]